MIGICHHRPSLKTFNCLKNVFMVAGDQHLIKLLGYWDAFSQTWLDERFPIGSIFAKTLAGKRVEANRAGMTPMRLSSGRLNGLL